MFTITKTHLALAVFGGVVVGGLATAYYYEGRLDSLKHTMFILSVMSEPHPGHATIPETKA
jgi:hypothetical protein